MVLDTGNGAASTYAGELFERLGAGVTLLHAAPDGRNVNERCGSTAPDEMAARVVAEGADLGAAFDGDADRCILADEKGEVRDGDAILYLWATCLHRSGRLDPPRIVATSMSNLGLERALEAEGIDIVRCGVGDRYVVEAMRKEGILLGGEQSGHIVQSHLASTGDGLLTAVQMAFLATRTAAPFGDARPLPALPAGAAERQGDTEGGLQALPAVTATAPPSSSAWARRPPRPALQRHRAPRPHHDRRPRAGDDRRPGRRAGRGDPGGAGGGIGLAGLGKPALESRRFLAELFRLSVP